MWWMWFGDRRNEKLAVWLTIITAVTVVLMAPPPQDRIIEGRLERVAVVNGSVVPSWLLFAAGIPLLVIVYFAFLKILDRFWSDGGEPEIVEVERMYETPEGMSIGWVPDTPGGGSPFDYEPPKWDERTTASDYLFANEPPSIRVLVIGMDESMKEDAEFRQEMEIWLASAPEPVLQGIIPAVEDFLSKYTLPEDPDDIEPLQRMVRASQVRGVPTESEMHALGNRLSEPNRSVYRKVLAGETLVDPGSIE